jgi:membrane fusion protein, multidrug efflux system
MTSNRVTAIGLVAAAALWIVSGHLLPSHTESKAAVRAGDAAVQKPFRVAVKAAEVVAHRNKLTLSGRTEADKKVMVTARGGGELTELKVRRGDIVKKGDVIAILSDDARISQVAQAQALVIQRKTELDAKRRLIDSGSLPKLELVNLESQYKAAEAALAGAEAERNRGVITAPWDGLITEVPAEVGGAAFSFSGKEIARIVSLDPMLAVVEVAERKLAGLSVGEDAEIRLVTGQIAKGKIRYVSKSASPTTRTYRVEIEVANPTGGIPDGITAEVTIPLSPTPAALIPRSGLTFSSAGDLGVRVVGADSKVQFVPVKIVEDDKAFMWVSGLADGMRVIVQGQDFVREGQLVDAVPAELAHTAQQ